MGPAGAQHLQQMRPRSSIDPIVSAARSGSVAATSPTAN